MPAPCGLRPRGTELLPQNFSVQAPPLHCQINSGYPQFHGNKTVSVIIIINLVIIIKQQITDINL